MKTILKLFLAVLLLSFATTSCATSVRLRPARGVVVTKLHQPKVIVHNNKRYYRNKGVWYVKKNRRYVTVAAPMGARVTTLPKGHRIVKIRGVQYYTCNGVYYKKSGRNYIVVNV